MVESHFTYAPADPSADLGQGDILRRTPAIEELLKEVHPHYLKADYRYFLVLTQSCDLVRRRGSRETACKARYITLAAIRPIAVVVNRYVADRCEQSVATDIPVCKQQVRNSLEQFLARLINNNEPNYFFLRGSPGDGFPEDACAFLALSIAIRASDHYETCLGARILGLESTFQAKLGWLTGQMYSRVGTQDWEPSELRSIVVTLTEGAAYWADDKALKHLMKAHSHEFDSSVSLDRLEQLVSEIPTKKDLALNEIERLIRDSPVFKELQAEDGSKHDREVRRLLQKLRSSSGLTQVLR
jgi:hypothetical protein